MDGYDVIKINQMSSGLYSVEIIGSNNEILLKEDSLEFEKAIDIIKERSLKEKGG